ncbi:hypothetical protein HZI31_06285 [Serratia fonticola]|uniref:hypothetical protein n=1 Tax=Serratia fonticola TaxID=47917 RepID=UPI0015C5ABA8|nr:hypothetical protein [Serratia fonticola]NYA42913.1 hypothetical protein [Serratia fonticola]
MKDALLIIRDQLTMGYKLSFAEVMLLQQAIDVAVNHVGDSNEKVPDDTRRMDWLVAHYVEVRKPLLYGSEKFFTAQTLTDEEDDYHATSLREQIDAAMAAAPTPTKAEAQQIYPIKPVLFANDYDLKNGWADHADTVTEMRQGYTVPLYAAPLLLDEIKDHKLNSGDKADDYHAGYQSGWNEYRDAIISAMNSAENGDVSKN